MKEVIGGVCAPKGFRAGGIWCGIRKNKTKSDLAMIVSDTMCTAAGVYTKNKVKGAPIVVTKNHLADGHAQAVICNSGNANTCAPNGMEIAEETCALTAKALGLLPTDIIVASTGVIGKEMEIRPFVTGIPQLADAITYEGSQAAAHAIMTTDTKLKEVAVEFTVGGKTCHMGAIAKGSGMIHPNMATMLCFITTDAAISAPMLQKALSDDVPDSFNQVSVDRDTSTNDTVTIMANGMAGNNEITGAGEDYQAFTEALAFVTRKLSFCIAADGEGASRTIVCQVNGAPTKETARLVSRSVISSNLFKAAVFGKDANWGRILCAIGYTDAEFDIEPIDVTLSSKAGSLLVCEKAAHHEFSEEKALEILSEDVVTVEVEMHQGNGSATAWGCDLTYDYVKINGDYRT
ncbi:bifunctional glutamate N-acetyltransferase/amino-acid acetyltransferase ArgJ [Candidatus Avoscillospira sp. LCP25S3_F1]|uniref:bifunctional glutamate N-acetyltransferase/amino-acid acetyltransferase ArgJ n=1 Tax=Candidatus Avoscillospira sp. LCP25S3_F1 TaxID=3438825 RepID=UPI003F8EDCAB